MNYDEQRELTRYIWDNYSNFRTVNENRAAMFMLLHQKAELSKDPSSAAILKQRASIFAGPEIAEALSCGNDVFKQRICARIMAQHSSDLFINRCPKCGYIVRTPKARQCLWCSFDWHKSA